MWRFVWEFSFAESPAALFGPDLKVHIQYPTHARFYYPDCSVVGDLRFGQVHSVDIPVVIVEVPSPSTLRTDESEKREGCFAINAPPDRLRPRTVSDSSLRSGRKAS